jgi:hypothetical protein
MRPSRYIARKIVARNRQRTSWVLASIPNWSRTRCSDRFEKVLFLNRDECTGRRLHSCNGCDNRVVPVSQGGGNLDGQLIESGLSGGQCGAVGCRRYAPTVTVTAFAV